MSVKSRLTKLENTTRSDSSVIFINAKESGDFRQQVESLIADGLDPTGRKFVYVEDPLQRLYEEIVAAGNRLVKEDAGPVG
jgi:hypothetical protein